MLLPGCVHSGDMYKAIHPLFSFLRLSKLASLVAQTVKKLPAMQETQVQSLGQEVSAFTTLGIKTDNLKISFN